jgi:outer membrane protein
MFLKVRSAVLFAASAVLAITTANAQTIAPAKVAIVNVQTAVVDTQEIKKAQAAMEAKFKPRQDAITNLQSQLQSLQQQMSAPNVTPQQQAQIQAEGQDKQRDLKRLTDDLQADVDQQRQDILGHAGRQMQQVLKTLAQQRGIDVIIDVSTTLYYKPALDITAEATAAYDRAYPAK